MYRFIFFITLCLHHLLPMAQVHQCGFDRLHAPENSEAIIKTIRNMRNKPAPRTTDTLLIPIVFHVIHNGEAIGDGSNVSDRDVLDLLNRLNADFLGNNTTFSETPKQWADLIAKPLIRFVLPSKNPQGQHTTGIERHRFPLAGSSFELDILEEQIKPQTAWNAEKYYNVWITRIPKQDGIIGYAFLPTEGVVGKTGRDGTVIDNRHLNSHVLTHETGHYLGLLHPFFQYSCEADDGLEDTPNMALSTREAGFNSCNDLENQGPISCEEPHMYPNFMDYSPEACYSSFSGQQVKIMRTILNSTFPFGEYLPRRSLVQAAPEVCPKPTTSDRPLQIVNIENFPQRTCLSGQLTPIIRVRNTSLQTVIGFRITVNHLDETYVYTYEKELIPNEEVRMNFASLPISLGQLRYTFTVQTGMADSADPVESDATFRWLTVFRNIDNIFDFEAVESIPSIYLETANDGNNWTLVNNNSALSRGDKAVQVEGVTAKTEVSYDLFGPNFSFPTRDGSKLRFDMYFEPSFADDSLSIYMSNACREDTTLLVLSTRLDTSFFAKQKAGVAGWGSYEILLPDVWKGEEVSFQFRLLKKNQRTVQLDNVGLKDCGIIPSYEIIGNPCVDTCEMIIQLDIQSRETLRFIRLNDIRVGNKARIEGQCLGMHQLRVQDVTGCEYNEDIYLLRDTLLEYETKLLPPSFDGASNGTIELFNKNLPPPIQYFWNTGDTTAKIEGLNEGIFRFSVQDGRRCTFHDSVILKVTNQCDSFLVGHQIDYGSCENTNDNKILITTTGSKEPIQYNWSTGFEEAALYGVVPGKYTVTVTDANNCQQTEEIEVLDIGEVQLVLQYEDPSCLTPSLVKINPLVGLPPYSVSWSNGQKGMALENLKNGTYNITLEDARGCQVSRDVDVNFGEAFLNINASKYNTSCHNSDDGRIELDVNGGHKPYSYMLNGDTISLSILQKLPKGTYRLRVMDSKDCQSQLNFEINAPDSMQILLEETKQNDSYIVSAKVEGGSPPYDFTWSDGRTGPIIKVSNTETLELVVEDANTCRKRVGMVEIIPTSTDNAQHLFEVYPVPTSDYIIIQNPSKAQTNAYIYNMFGQLVKSFSIIQTTHKEDLGDLVTGNYLLVLEREGYKEVKRIQLLKK